MQGSVCITNTEDSPSSRLLQLQRRQGEPVLFMGDVAEVERALYLSDYSTRRGAGTVNVPEFLSTLFNYIVSVSLTTFPVSLFEILSLLLIPIQKCLQISAALAVINILPAFFLDGQVSTMQHPQVCFT